MKKLGVLVFLGLITSLTGCQTSSQAKDNFKKLEWLEGTWINTQNEANQTTHERWQKNSLAEFIGVGVTMSGEDTVFVEKLRIIIRDNDLFYVADVPENKEPVYFKFTEVTASGFVCENPGHDFPKKITYQLDGNKLKATTSGDGKSVDFYFEKK